MLLTSALPYGNGKLHFGHVYEFIITDIVARYNRLRGRHVLYVCATDAHGTPIEINAAKAGKKPAEFVLENHEMFKKMLDAFRISVDNYHITHSRENEQLAREMFETAKKNGYIYEKDIELFYCEKCERFLPDRYIKGTCPKCNASDQYGDVCEVCGATYSSTELTDAYCAICGSKPVRRKSRHYFFRLSAFQNFLKEYIEKSNFQEEVKHYLMGWIEKGLQDWCISRDGPYFGFKIPGEENKYFYVWWDAPIGYVSSTANYCEKHGCDWREYWKNDACRIVHVIGKDIIYFHYLFWPAMLKACNFSLPAYIYTHGFLTIDGQKMSKSRGTFITAEEYLRKVGDVNYLRFYFAAHTSSKLVDIDLSREEFLKTVNNVLVDNFANFVYRVLSFLWKYYDGVVGKQSDAKEERAKIAELINRVQYAYDNWNFKEAVESIMELAALGNAYFQKHEPWKLVKEDKEKAQEILSFSAEIVKNLAILIKPILPEISEKIEKCLNLENLSWSDLEKKLEEGHRIKKPAIIIRKIEKFDLF